MSTRAKALFAILVAAILWASAGATAKLLFLHAPPLVVAFHRFFLASLLILPFFLNAKKSKTYFFSLVPLGIFNALNILFYYSGLALTTANTSTTLGTAVPITVTLLSYFLIKEKVSKQKLLGVGIGLIGTLLIVLVPLVEKDSMFSGSILGNSLLMCSLLSWTFYIVYSRSILSSGSHSPIVSTGVNIFTVTVFTFLASLINGNHILTSSLFTPSYFVLLLYAAIGITILTFFLFQWAVQHISASTVSLKEYLQLILGVGINALLLGEQLTSSYVIGSILVGCGVFIATSDRLTKKLASSLFNKSE